MQYKYNITHKLSSLHSVFERILNKSYLILANVEFKIFLEDVVVVVTEFRLHSTHLSAIKTIVFISFSRTSIYNRIKLNSRPKEMKTISSPFF